MPTARIPRHHRDKRRRNPPRRLHNKTSRHQFAPEVLPSPNLAQTLRASRDENSIQLPLGSEPNMMLTSGMLRRSSSDDTATPATVLLP